MDTSIPVTSMPEATIELEDMATVAILELEAGIKEEVEAIGTETVALGDKISLIKIEDSEVNHGIRLGKGEMMVVGVITSAEEEEMMVSQKEVTSGGAALAIETKIITINSKVVIHTLRAKAGLEMAGVNNMVKQTILMKL